MQLPGRASDGGGAGAGAVILAGDVKSGGW